MAPFLFTSQPNWVFFLYMNDKRTEKQKYAAWVESVNKAHAKGWTHVEGWNFKSPKGAVVDISAFDLEKLDEIERSYM